MPAIVVLTDGSSFEGEAEYDGAAVRFTGRVRHASLVGGEPTVVYGRDVLRLWPLSRVSEIRWEGE